MIVYEHEQQMKICSHCGAVYYIAGSVCPYCGRCGQEEQKVKKYHLQSVLVLLMGVLALGTLPFSFSSILFAGGALFLGSYVISRMKNFQILAWLGTAFGLIAVLALLVSFGTNLYYILQMLSF